MSIRLTCLICLSFRPGDHPKTSGRSRRSAVQHAPQSEPTFDAGASFARHEQLIGRLQQLHRPASRPSAWARQQSVGRRLVPSISSVHILTLPGLELSTTSLNSSELAEIRKIFLSTRWQWLFVISRQRWRTGLALFFGLIDYCIATIIIFMINLL